MSSSDSNSKVIVLKSSDGEAFEVSQGCQAVALQSKTIAHMIKDDSDSKMIGVPISNVTGKTLAKVIEYCMKHVAGDDGASSSTEDELKAWDADYMKIDKGELFALMLAANFLNIKDLLDLCCQTAGVDVTFLSFIRA